MWTLKTSSKLWSNFWFREWDFGCNTWIISLPPSDSQTKFWPEMLNNIKDEMQQTDIKDTALMALIFSILQLPYSEFSQRSRWQLRNSSRIFEELRKSFRAFFFKNSDGNSFWNLEEFLEQMAWANLQIQRSLVVELESNGGFVEAQKAKKLSQ